MTPTSQAKDALITSAQVLEKLNGLVDPKSGRGLADAGLVQGLVLRNGRAGFMIEVAGEDVALYEPVREAAERLLAGLDGVERAQVVLTADEKPAAPGVTRVRKGVSLANDPAAQVRPRAAERPENVKRVIAVASGKGGVGKSTVAVNLALALARSGLRVGLLDVDVYGPSIPTLLGVNESPERESGKLNPIRAHGLVLMSIGFIADQDAPLIWRGPMASGATKQMIRDVNWASPDAPLDVLVMDLPPGTGDIHLTLIQDFAIDGAVIVSTPSEVALIDARKAARMFVKLGAKIFGVVENMAWLETPAGRLPIFGEGGAAREAQALGVPLLGQVPIDIELRQAGDEGRIVETGPVAEVFDAIAALVLPVHDGEGDRA